MEKPSQEYSLITTVLQETYQDELLILGPALLEDLMSGYNDFKDPQNGSNLDQSMIVGLITSSISLLTVLIQLYMALIKDKKEKPSEITLRKTISEKLTTVSIKDLNDQQVEILVTNFIKKVETNSNVS